MGDDSDNSSSQVPDAVLAAVKSNNSSIVSKWLTDLSSPLSTNGKQLLRQVLLCSVECLSLDVIRLFQPPVLSKELLRELINTHDSDGMSILYCAAQVSLPSECNSYFILEILAHLCEHGGDLRIDSEQRSAKKLAKEKGNKMTETLLELLENIQSKRSKRTPVPDYEDIVALHKTILHWAVGTERHQVVSHIFIMHQRGLYDKMTFFLFETDPNSVQDFSGAPIYTAAKIGNPKLLEALIARSGISLNTILGQRQKQAMPRPDGPDWERHITPLSLILFMPKNRELIEILNYNGSAKRQYLTSTDLSKTMLPFLPPEIFMISYLSTLNISDNEISDLPLSKLPSECYPNTLQELNVSHNKLQHIPSELFNLPCLKTLNMSHNPLKSLPKEWWTTKSIITLNVSHTHLENLSIDDSEFAAQVKCSSAYLQHSVVHGQYSVQTSYAIPVRAKSLSDYRVQHLNCSHCNINKFPGLLAYCVPNLEVLNLSNNKLQSCCAINELPNSLVDLDLSNNYLSDHQEHELFYRDIELQNSCMRHTELNNMKYLKLASNTNLRTLTLHDEHKHEANNSTRVFFPKLVRLNISNCGLIRAPEYLAGLEHLTDLDISNNKNLSIPHEICDLNHLINFSYDKVMDPIANTLNTFTLTREKRMFLNPDHSEKYPAVKLIFVGQNLINLPSHLTEKKFQGKGISLIVVDQHMWCISKDKGALLSITFNVWNFIGQDEYAPASQCFLTGNALYVLCWNITTDQDHGIANLKNWLLRIQGRAKGASVIVIGCQVGNINGRLRRQVNSEVQALCQSYSDSFYFPKVLDIQFVSRAKLKEDMIKLCASLYDAASELRISFGSKNFNCALKDMKIPISYFKFQGMVSSKVSYFEKHKDEGLPILTWNDIVAMVKSRRDAKPMFRDQKEIEVAVDYMKESGLILHFDFPSVSDYYFIDPHWLYDVFCRVCKSPIKFNSSRINAEDGKLSRSNFQQIFDECSIPEKFYKTIFQLLQRLEIVIPLNSNQFLLPSTLSSDSHNKLYSSVNCKFPCDRVPRTLSLQKKFSLSNILLDAEPTPKDITLQFTNMCYRRLFLSHHIPDSFWAKLISRFIASAKNFYDILLSNCVEGITIERMVNAGDAVICNQYFRWLYWSNGITLTFGDYVLLCVNGLMQAGTDTKVEGHKIPLSVTVDKIRTMRFFNGRTWEQLFHEDTDGFEVNVPDYVVHSSVEEIDKTRISDKLGAQILSLVLDILNELCTDFYTGQSDKGIFSDSYFTQLVTCPLCYGDRLGDDSDETDDEQKVYVPSSKLHTLVGQSIKPLDVDEDVLVPSSSSSFGFYLQICVFNAQKDGTVSCPTHGNVKLRYLTPDLVFEDVTMNKVCASQVEGDFQQLGKGGFGSVFKVKYASDDVALKCFTNFYINGKLMEIELKELAMRYSDMRLEVNKLSTANHPNIVKFLGLCVVSFSILLEWAPKGNLDHIINEHRIADTWICPDAVAATVHQVSSALAYLHVEKNIVHFDIKPENILVFKYPQAGHFCFSKETSLKCEFCEGGGVLVKLADLGISALVGPSGFLRKNATPTYVAPEVLKFLGKEPLTKKVDIFSLGISLYEVMTLRKLPPEGSANEFSADIIAGRRPEFLPEDPNYPIELRECVQNCWAQDCKQRPTAKRIEDAFKSSNCLTLKNYYNISNQLVSAVLVTNMTDKDGVLIWIASSAQNGYTLTPYTFADQDDSFTHVIKKAIHPKLCVDGDPVKLKSPVKALCHDGGHIWIVYDNGTLAVCDVSNHTIVKDVVVQKLPVKPVAIVIANCSGGVAAVAYANGLIVFLWTKNIISGSDPAMVHYHSSTTITVSFKLNTIETCSISDGHSQLWCSYDIGVIQIVKPPVSTSGETEIVKVVEIKEYCTDLPHDTSIVQLKCSPNQDHKSTVMYALHDGGLAISCWSVDVDPKLYTIIKPSLSNPATVILPAEHAVYFGDSNGTVHVVHTHSILDGAYATEVLPGGHHSKVDFLVALHGMMNAQGFLSGCGVTTKVSEDEQTRPNSMYYERRLTSVPCVVLVSIGVGYQELFKQIANDTYFVTWAVPSRNQDPV